MPDPRIFPIVNIVDTFATVGVASTLVRPANDRRVFCQFVNDGDEVCYLAEGSAAVMGSGDAIYPSGVARIETDNMFYGAIYAICETGDLNLSITEGSN
jgi:hypothetical protein